VRAAPPFLALDETLAMSRDLESTYRQRARVWSIANRKYLGWDTKFALRLRMMYS
jgi:hypothetical protein